MKKKVSPLPFKKLLCEFLRLFYAKGWVSGTGGGICGKLSARQVFIAPTGVHKERVQPLDFFTVNPSTSKILKAPRNRSLRLSECSSIFCEIIRSRGAGSVMHSHALSAVLAADLSQGRDQLLIERFEMLKGVRGVGNMDQHLIPVIQNTPVESKLVSQIRDIFSSSDFKKTFCILVRDHGAYIWGEDVWETKRHAEVYHFLFEGVVGRSKSI